jgi:phosphate-selective porin
MRTLNLALLIGLLAACAAQQASAPCTPVYVTRTVKDCSWLPQMTASAADTPDTKREIIAYEIARQKNCPSK